MSVTVSYLNSASRYTVNYTYATHDSTTGTDWSLNSTIIDLSRATGAGNPMALNASTRFQYSAVNVGFTAMVGGETTQIFTTTGYKPENELYYTSLTIDLAEDFLTIPNILILQSGGTYNAIFKQYSTTLTLRKIGQPAVTKTVNLVINFNQIAPDKMPPSYDNAYNRVEKIGRSIGSSIQLLSGANNHYSRNISNTLANTFLKATGNNDNYQSNSGTMNFTDVVFYSSEGDQTTSIDLYDSHIDDLYENDGANRIITDVTITNDGTNLNFNIPTTGTYYCYFALVNNVDGDLETPQIYSSLAQQFVTDYIELQITVIDPMVFTVPESTYTVNQFVNPSGADDENLLTALGITDMYVFDPSYTTISVTHVSGDHLLQEILEIVDVVQPTNLSNTNNVTPSNFVKFVPYFQSSSNSVYTVTLTDNSDNSFGSISHNITIFVTPEMDTPSCTFDSDSTTVSQYYSPSIIIVPNEHDNATLNPNLKFTIARYEEYGDLSDDDITFKYGSSGDGTRPSASTRYSLWDNTVHSLEIYYTTGIRRSGSYNFIVRFYNDESDTTVLYSVGYSVNFANDFENPIILTALASTNSDAIFNLEIDLASSPVVASTSNVLHYKIATLSEDTHIASTNLGTELTVGDYLTNNMDIYPAFGGTNVCSFSLVVVDIDGNERAGTQSETLIRINPSYSTITYDVTYLDVTNVSLSSTSSPTTLSFDSIQSVDNWVQLTFTPNDADFNDAYGVYLNWKINPESKYIDANSSTTTTTYEDSDEITKSETVANNSKLFDIDNSSSDSYVLFDGAHTLKFSTNTQYYGRGSITVWLTCDYSARIMQSNSIITIVNRVNNAPIAYDKRIYLSQGRKYDLNPQGITYYGTSPEALSNPNTVSSAITWHYTGADQENHFDGTSDDIILGRNLLNRSFTRTVGVPLIALDGDHENGNNISMDRAGISVWPTFLSVVKLSLADVNVDVSETVFGPGGNSRLLTNLSDPTSRCSLNLNGTFNTTSVYPKLFKVNESTYDSLNSTFQNFCTIDSDVHENSILLDITSDDMYGKLVITYKVTDNDSEVFNDLPEGFTAETKTSNTATCTLYVLPYAKLSVTNIDEGILEPNTSREMNLYFFNGNNSDDRNMFAETYLGITNNPAVATYIQNRLKLYITNNASVNISDKLLHTVPTNINFLTIGSYPNGPNSYIDNSIYWAGSDVAIPFTFSPTLQGEYNANINIGATNFYGTLSTVIQQFIGYCGDGKFRNLVVGDTYDQLGTVIINGDNVDGPALTIHGNMEIYDPIISHITETPESPTQIGYTMSEGGNSLPVGESAVWQTIASINVPAGVWRIDGYCMLGSTMAEGIASFMFGLSMSDNTIPNYPTTTQPVRDNHPIGGPCMSIITGVSENTTCYLNYSVSYSFSGDLSILPKIVITRIA